MMRKLIFFFFGKHIFMYTYEIEIFMFRETIFGISQRAKKFSVCYQSYSIFLPEDQNA